MGLLGQATGLEGEWTAVDVYGLSDERHGDGRSVGALAAVARLCAGCFAQAFGPRFADAIERDRARESKSKAREAAGRYG